MTARDPNIVQDTWGNQYDSSVPYDAAACTAAFVKITQAPLEITDADIHILRGLGLKESQKAEAARARARQAQPAAVQHQPAESHAHGLQHVESKDLKIRRMLLEHLPFFGLAHVSNAPPPGVFQREAYNNAAKRFVETPHLLTDADLDQLQIVDPNLAERARERRAASGERESDADRELDLAAVPFGLFVRFRDMCEVQTLALRYRLNDAHNQLNALQARVTVLETQRQLNAGAKSMVTADSDLAARVRELEERPQGVRDAGVWAAGKVYNPGDIVTFMGGGWICNASHMATGYDIDHARFRLFVKAGRNGKDAPSVRKS